MTFATEAARAGVELRTLRGVINIAKGPETSNPLDLSSEATGNTCYALNEVYESQAGVDDHWQQAQNWEHFGDLFAWASKCKVTTMHGSPVVRSHW